MFDPKPHLIQLPRRVKDPQTGHWTTRLDDYLEVKWRLVWFREKFPHGVIETEEVCVDLERGYARYRAVVCDGEGGKATGYGTETAAGFVDYVERAETRALGRALAALGIGTQFVGADLTEGDHVADAPVVSTNGHPVVTREDRPPADSSANGAVSEHDTVVSSPTTIPPDSGLPCAGVFISALKPPQLAMLISKVARLLHDEGERWVRLLHALEMERNARLAQGRKPRRPDPDLDPVGHMEVEGEDDVP